MSSSDTVIRVDRLSKAYRLGKRKPYKTMRESLTGVLTAPFRRLAGNGEAKSTADSFWALKDISFEVKRGEVVGIIGRNGAGKSTLLKVLSRITEPSDGEAELIGRVGSLLEVGTGFHPELTGRENIYLNGAILGMRRGEIVRKFDEIVSFAETEQFLDTQVKHYSSGMYTRLAFAVAAHLESEILIVDEVLAVGDAAFQKKCLAKMKDVSGQGRTVLFVSHNMNAVEQLCTSAILLQKGTVKSQSDSVRSVIREYMSSGDAESPSWTNSGEEFSNSYFRPVRFHLGDERGADAGTIYPRTSEVWIHLEGDVEVLDPGLTIGYAIFTEEGTCIYWSYQTDSSEDAWPVLKRGRQRLQSRLPIELLNEGTYRLEMIGGLTNRQWLFEPGVNAPAIFFTVSGGLSSSPLYNTARPTLLAPILPWKIIDA